MTNKEKFDNVLIETLSLTADQLKEDLVYNSVRTWDSVGHMAMVARLESEFEIMLETDDILDFSSYPKGMEILRKYGIEF